MRCAGWTGAGRLCRDGRSRNWSWPGRRRTRKGSGGWIGLSLPSSIGPRIVLSPSLSLRYGVCQNARPCRFGPAGERCLFEGKLRRSAPDGPARHAEEAGSGDSESDAIVAPSRSGTSMSPHPVRVAVAVVSDCPLLRRGLEQVIDTAPDLREGRLRQGERGVGLRDGRRRRRPGEPTVTS